MSERLGTFTQNCPTCLNFTQRGSVRGKPCTDSWHDIANQSKETPREELLRLRNESVQRKADLIAANSVADQAVTECVALRTAHEALSAEVAGLRKDYAELECLARLREDDHDRMQEKLREDKERLDWMEGCCAEMIQIGDEGGNLIYRITPGGHGEEVPDYEARTLRAAIDAAREGK